MSQPGWRDRELAIPLLAVTAVAGVFNNGTGFLGRRHTGQVGLFTAAHVPTKAQPIHTENWVGWPNSIHAFTSPSNAIEVPLFSATGEPLFAYLEGTGGQLADMMGFLGPTYDGVITALQAQYEVVDLENPTAWSLATGQQLTCLGYPLLGADAKWPYLPASSRTGPFRGVREGPMFEADIETGEGFSGGPVSKADDGILVGMLIGNSDGLARVVPGGLLATLEPTATTPRG